MFYDRVADNDIFPQLKQNFESLLQYAYELKASLPEFETNLDWDKEYNRLVPTEFYRRNVEDVTSEQAFHMVLLQFFAKNEEWMIENGLLVNGELNVYINQDNIRVQNLLSQIVENI